MDILGLTLGILITVSGAFLLATAEDDAFANISGTVFIILGPMWCGFYFAILMGW